MDADLKKSIEFLYRVVCNGRIKEKLGDRNQTRIHHSAQQLVVDNALLLQYNNDSLVGNYVQDAQVVQARGLLGYILAIGEYFHVSNHRASTGSTSKTGNVNASAANIKMSEFFQSMNLNAIDMLEMLSSSAAQSDSNAVAGIGYLTLTGFEYDFSQVYIKPNTKLAKDLFHQVAGKHCIYS